jgi:hypothetical protein
MAAVAFTTQTNTVLGEMSNGMKVVSTTLTTATANVDVLQITVTPLKRIVVFFPSFKKHAALEAAMIFAAGTLANQVAVTPTAACTNAVIEIISFGY